MLLPAGARTMSTTMAVHRRLAASRMRGLPAVLPESTLAVSPAAGLKFFCDESVVTDRITRWTKAKHF